MSHLTSPADPVSLSQYNPGFKTLLVTGASTLGSVTATSITAPIVKNIVTLAAGTASQSLTVAQSGALVLVPVVSQATALTLPAVATAQGVTYKLLFANAAPGSGKTFTISKNASDGAIIIGTLLVGPYSAPLLVQSMNAGCSNIIRSATAGVAGEVIDLACDGTYWYATGSSTGTAPWTIS